MVLFLAAFAKPLKASITSCSSVSLPIHLFASIIAVPTKQIYVKFCIWTFMKIGREIPDLVTMGAKISGTLH
jgi:hypothetical protein